MLHSDSMVLKTDKAILSVVFTTFLTFLLLFFLPIRSLGIGAIWCLYPNLLLATAWLGYLIRIQHRIKEVESSPILYHSVLFGLAATAIFIPMDRLFSRHGKLLFIIYSSPDFLGNVTTPVGLIMTWVLFATLAIYCYLRLEMLGFHRFVASSIVGFVAAIGSIAIYALGKELWMWNSLRVNQISNIMTVPIFIPFTYLLTFVMCPYYFYRKQHPLVAGMRCGLFLGIMMFLSFMVLWRT